MHASAVIGSPHWMDNTESVSCLCCSSEFTLFNRRHHCRLCCRLVCNDCSKSRLPVSGHPEPQRVCDGCIRSRGPPRTPVLPPSMSTTPRLTATFPGVALTAPPPLPPTPPPPPPPCGQISPATAGMIAGMIASTDAEVARTQQPASGRMKSDSALHGSPSEELRQPARALAHPSTSQCEVAVRAPTAAEIRTAQVRPLSVEDCVTPCALCRMA